MLADKQAEYEQRHRMAMDAYRTGSPKPGMCMAPHFLWLIAVLISIAIVLQPCWAAQTPP